MATALRQVVSFKYILKLLLNFTNHIRNSPVGVMRLQDVL